MIAALLNSLDMDLVRRLLVWMGVFLCVFLTVVATALSQDKENRLLYRIITGSDDVEIKEREKPPRAEFLVRLEHLARGAGLKMDGVGVFILCLAAGGAGFSLLMGLFSSASVAWIAVPVGMYIPVFWMKERAKKRGFGMILQLAEALTRMGNMIRSGANLDQAVVAVADTVPDPLGVVFRRMRETIQRNRPALIAMEQAVPDIPINEYKTVCTVAQIHSQLGGDMAASFDDIAATLKDLHDQQENLNTQTTAVRLSSVIVGLAPFGTVAALQIVSGGTYYNDFLKTLVGKVVVILCFLSILYGWYRIFKMAEFRLE